MVVFGPGPSKRKSHKSGLVISLSWLNITLLVVSGCGGGGGSGAASAPPSVSAPPPISAIEETEISNSPGLNLVAASHLYDHGRRGSGFAIAVLDSGVDANHAELEHRVTGGGDWQGDTQGLMDPNGHGTHVASIAAAARDGVGMQGIAPEAEILSYRILNEIGVFGDRSGNVMLPQIITDIDRRGISIINNSWASFYEITDFPKSVIENALEEEILSYRNSVDRTGPVYVWAAGNGGEDEVSVRSGLPHFYPELEDQWLAVVSVDQFGREPVYTNRCGQSAAWCITAPGGGDDEESAGIIGAKAGGGYTLKSGTSMAAPLVSGALSLVMEAMPTITPQAAATRLKHTATLDGLTTSSGCTIQTCSEADMRDVFGLGLLNVESALQPIGSASVITNSQQKTPWVGTTLVTPSVMGPALNRGFDGAVAVIHDSFDGAMMLTTLRPIIHTAPPPVKLPSIDAPTVTTIPLSSGLFITPSSAAPPSHDGKAQLIDVPSSPTETWQGWRLTSPSIRTTGHKTQRVMLGNGRDRQAIHLMQTHHNGAFTSHWYGFGMDRTNGWMDGISRGAVATRGSTSQWIFMGFNHGIGEVELTAETLLGRTSLMTREDSLIQGGEMIYDALALRSIYHAGPFDLGVSLTRPPALRKGHVILNQPQRISTEHVDFVTQRYDVALDARENRVGLHLGYMPQQGMSLNITAGYVANLGHQSGQDGSQLGIQFSQKF